eukprot:7403541-Ditylum_brightwellii.AAC.1
MMNIDSNTVTALEQYQGATTAAMRNIMKNVVVDKLEEQYTNKNITLLLWLYDDASLRDELLCDTFVDELHAMAEANAGTKRRPKMQHVCKKLLSAIQQGEDNCPLMLQKMTFNIFLHYLTMQKKSKGKLLPQTAYSCICSSLCHLYRMTGQDIGPEFKKNMGHFLSGMKQTVVKRSQN